MPRTRPPYPPEFRRQAVELIRSGVSIKEAAGDLGVSEQTLRNWVLCGSPDKTHYPELRIIRMRAREARCRRARVAVRSG